MDEPLGGTAAAKRDGLFREGLSHPACFRGIPTDRLLCGYLLGFQAALGAGAGDVLADESARACRFARSDSSLRDFGHKNSGDQGTLAKF
jgi:hypothetical protein